MKKRIGLLLVLIIGLSACMPMPFGTNTKVDIEKTNNGNIIFTSNEELKKIQSKQQVESIVNENNNTIADELGLDDPKSISYEKNHNKFNIAQDHQTKTSEYALAYADFINEESYSVYKIYDLNAGDQLNVLDELSEKNIKEYNNKKSNAVVDTIIKKEINKTKDGSAIKNEDLSAPTKGKYELRAFPIIRTLYFKDIKQIYDYELSVVYGMEFKLVKVK